MGTGYRKNIANGKLEIMDDTILEALNGDEQSLDSNIQAMYQLQNNTTYKRTDQKITLEWR